MDVVAATFGCACFGGEANASMPVETDLVEGVLGARGREFCKAVYHVWFKRSFANAKVSFFMLFGGLVGVGHVFSVLPLIAMSSMVGFHAARMGINAWTFKQCGLVLVSAITAGTVDVGALGVVARRKPPSWS